jgi:hypothetical protein
MCVRLEALRWRGYIGRKCGGLRHAGSRGGGDESE